MTRTEAIQNLEEAWELALESVNWAGETQDTELPHIISIVNHLQVAISNLQKDETN